MKLLILFFYIFSLEYANAKTIMLLGQFHLSQKQMTENIEESKKLPQYYNQKTIYMILDEWVKTKKIDLILSEGCEGEINKTFKHIYNGWNYNTLAKLKHSSKYKDILTLIPLKIEVKYVEKIKVICGDDYELIKKHQLVFSDLRAYAGLNLRLKESRNKSSKYKSYLSVLEESEKQVIKNPIEYTRLKVIELLNEENLLIEKRNKVFIEKIESSKASTITVIIGNRHIKNLRLSLEKLGHFVKTVELVQNTIPQEDYVSQLKLIFSK